MEHSEGTTCEKVFGLPGASRKGTETSLKKLKTGEEVTNRRRPANVKDDRGKVLPRDVTKPKIIYRTTRKRHNSQTIEGEGGIVGEESPTKGQQNTPTQETWIALQDSHGDK